MKKLNITCFANIPQEVCFSLKKFNSSSSATSGDGNSTGDVFAQSCYIKLIKINLDFRESVLKNESMSK